MGSACQWNAAAGTRTSERGRGRLAVGAGLQRLGVGSLARGPRSGLRGVLAWGDWSAGPGCREAEGESAARWRAGDARRGQLAGGSDGRGRAVRRCGATQLSGEGAGAGLDRGAGRAGEAAGLLRERRGGRPAAWAGPGVGLGPG